MEMQADNRAEGVRGIAGSTLKLIAIVTMLIDHVAATILARIMQQQGIDMYIMGGSTEPIAILYTVMRLIGRLAFPIFIFLLIEGLEHTRNQWNYLLRLVLFAIVSELPFDFALNLDMEQIMAGQLLEWGSQNVFFTLSIGLFAIIGIKAVQATELPLWIQLVGKAGIAVAAMLVAYFLHTDYGEIGVLAIVVMYLLRKQRIAGVFAVCWILVFSSSLELAALFALIPIVKYNGTRGWKLKWLFYIVYPVHLLILWLVCWKMGIA